MKWAVVVFPGSNCDEDAAAAVRRVTGDSVDMVWHSTEDLNRYDAIILPGGFSYGDYLRSGAIARFSPVLEGVRKAAATGTLVLGICNGFQVLTEAGLLPGGLLRNDHLQFHCELVELRVENADLPFTSGYQVGDIIRIPIAHGEGRYYVDQTALTAMQANRRVAFTYVGNVNGSLANIAGVVNAQGNVLGLMPHPERAVVDWMGSTDGCRMFESMARYVAKRGVVHAG